MKTLRMYVVKTWDDISYSFPFSTLREAKSELKRFQKIYTYEVFKIVKVK